MKIKWLGHASWKISTCGKIIYIDPYIGEYDDKADVILSSHHHDDHCKPDKVALIKKADTEIIAPPECGKKLGIEVISLKPGEAIKLGDVLVEAVEAYNYKRFRSPGNPFHPRGIGVGYLITAEDKIIYHVGDSDFIPEMKELKDIDVMLVPSGGTYTMDNHEAAEATIALRPKIAIPMHIWDTDPKEFKKLVEQSADIKVKVMKPGEELTL